MKKNKYSLIPAVLLAVVFTAAAQAGERNNFLSHGPSAAAYGRGEASASKLDDVSSFFYNPSLLSGLQRPEITLSHYLLYEGSKYSFAGAGIPLENAYISVSGINLRSGDVDILRNITEEFSTINTNLWAYYLSYARLLPAADLDLGASVKYVYQDMAGSTGGGYGLDIGAHKTVEAPDFAGNEAKINLGINLENIIQPSVKLISADDTYPALYRLGATFESPVYTRASSYDTLLVSADIVSEDEVFKYFTGVEYIFFNRYSLRAGYYRSHTTFGAGVDIGSLKLDYAFDIGEYTSFHRLGLSVRLGPQTQRAQKAPAVEKVSADSAVPSLMSEAKAALALEEQRRAKLLKELVPQFKSAKKDFRKKRYLKASEKFADMLIKFPEFSMAKRYYSRIEMRMQAMAQDTSSSDLESISYAQGYLNFKGDQFNSALNDWEKTLQVNPKRVELEEYIARVKAYLADLEKQRKDKEIEERVKAAYAEAVSNFDKSLWIPCIKGMEKIKDICKNEPFSKSYDYSVRAQDYIDKAVKELSKTMKVSRARKQEEQQVKEPQLEIDADGAQKKYNEGLILYAQGKLADAVKLWEIAVRLNPSHEKAVKALEKAKEELDLSRKK